MQSLLVALDELGDEQATVYCRCCRRGSAAGGPTLLGGVDTTPTREYKSEIVRRFVFQGRAEGRAEGEAVGEAKAVLEVLDARGLKIPDDLRQRITDCTDLDQLMTWIRRAVTTDTVYDLF